jgi:hypothetical protein
MTPASPDILQLHKLKPLSPALLGAIAFCVCLLFVGGQFIGLPVVVFPIVAIVVSIGLYFAKSGDAALRLFIGTSFALTFRMGSMEGFDIVDILAGLAMGGVLLVWWIRLLLIERVSLTYTVPQLFASLYIAWGLFIGVGGILWWNNSLNDWVRELLIMSPLLVVPMLYVRLFEAGSAAEVKFQRFIFFATISIMVVSIAKYIIAVKQSSFAYEISRLAADQSPSLIMILMCVAFALYKVKELGFATRLIISMIGVGLLILSGYRTMWVTTALGIMIMFFMTHRRQWQGGLKFILSLGGILAAVGTYMFFTIRIFEVFVMMTFNRLVSTTAISTDGSLVNRYIETAIVEQNILRSPLVGYGFGAKFQTFDWLRGYSYLTGYSHNGYFFVAFKAGLIGFALIFTAYFWFMVKAFKLARNQYESARTRAIATVAFCYFCCLLVANLTINIFGERNTMIWLGLFWSFIMVRELAARKRASTDGLIAASA